MGNRRWRIPLDPTRPDTWGCSAENHVPSLAPDPTERAKGALWDVSGCVLTSPYIGAGIDGPAFNHPRRYSSNSSDNVCGGSPERADFAGGSGRRGVPD
jgi:hypothetical protein